MLEKGSFFRLMLAADGFPVSRMTRDTGQGRLRADEGFGIAIAGSHSIPGYAKRPREWFGRLVAARGGGSVPTKEALLSAFLPQLRQALARLSKLWPKRCVTISP
jgi:hypothetical protein